jgi:hypothetical protein
MAQGSAHDQENCAITAANTPIFFSELGVIHLFEERDNQEDDLHISTIGSLVGINICAGMDQEAQHIQGNL